MKKIRELFPSAGIDLITAERKRQIEEKGYDANHDDDHGDDMLRVTTEIVNYVDPVVTIDPNDEWGILAHTNRRFPVEAHADIRLLVIAGALLAAEIDRRIRLIESEEPAPRSRDYPDGNSDG